MKRLLTSLLIPALFIGIAPKLSATDKGTQYPGVHPDEVDYFLTDQSKLIFIALECLRRGGATQRQKNEYLNQRLKEHNIEPSVYRQRMTKQNQISALKELSSYKPLLDGTSICELRRMEAFNESEDYKYSFDVVNIETNLRCINKLMQIRGDMTEAHVARWLSDQQQKWGVSPAAYNRLLNDKLRMPKRLASARKVGCSNREQKAAVSLFQRDYLADSHSAKIPLNQLTASDYKSQHQRCKDVRDYQGCMNYKNNATAPSPKSSFTPAQDYCPDNADGWCVAGEGRDRFNMRKMKGWQYKEFTDGDVLYIDPIAKRVPHKGQPYRYIAERQVFRYYSTPTSGTPGSYTTIGSASTNCTGYGAMINCTTTPAPRIYNPGIPGSAGGVKSIERTMVVDCVDGTSSLYIGNKAGKWKPVNKNTALFSYCEKRTTLPPLEMKL